MNPPDVHKLFTLWDGRLCWKRRPREDFGSEAACRTFATFEEACDAREKAERENGYHINHGRV